jgi:hypothetical protein
LDRRRGSVTAGRDAGDSVAAFGGGGVGICDCDGFDEGSGVGDGSDPVV